MTAAIEAMPGTGSVAILAALGLSVATFYRGRKPKPPAPKRPAPARTLSPEERTALLEVLHEERFRDSPPAEIIPVLLAEGKYLASERTMYRVLADNHEVRERRNQLVHPVYAKPELIATAPNQVWSWDITKLLTFEKFSYLYLYVIMDIFSRYVVGWLLSSKENAVLATRLINETVAKHDVAPGELTVHADRGAPMRSKLLSQLLAQLDVTKSHSRPHTSNDNAFSESQFKTMKYHRDFPGRFHGDGDGNAFCKPWFNWYNEEHHHSGIAMLTPADVHFARAEEVLKHRHDVMMATYDARPERFVNGPPRLGQLPSAVYINPPTTTAAPATGSEPALGLATPSPAPGERQPPPGGLAAAVAAMPFSLTATFTDTGGNVH